jgi:hypothetical protein
MREMVVNVVLFVGWLGVLMVFGLTVRGVLQMREQERRERSQRAK